MSSSPDFSPSCPSGGKWYACGVGVKFVGCCASNPCNNIGCPKGNLRPASFDPSYYGQMSDQQCSAGQWYTCQDNSPPFMGCCKSNPCSPDGCPGDDLAAGYLSADSTANQYDPYPPIGSDRTSSTSSTTRPTTTSTGTQVPSTQTASPLSSSPPKINIKAVIGGSVAGGVFLIAVALIMLYWRHTRKSREDFRASSRLFQPATQVEKGEGRVIERYAPIPDGKGPTFHEAPNDQPSPPPAFSPPAPRYSAHRGPTYHEVPTDDGPFHHSASQWSPHTPPGSPDRNRTSYAPIISSSAYDHSQQYGAPTRHQRSPSSPLEYDSTRNAWTSYQPGLGLDGTQIPTYPSSREREQRWPGGGSGYQ